MRILNPPLLAILAASVFLAGCPSEECKDKICTNEPAQPKDPLNAYLRVSSAGWDSVVVELHSGSTVERGALLSRQILKGGQIPVGIAVSEGTYSAKATYMRQGDTLEVFDSEDASWDSNKDECGCVTGWSRSNAVLDLYAH